MHFRPREGAPPTRHRSSSSSRYFVPCVAAVIVGCCWWTRERFRVGVEVVSSSSFCVCGGENLLWITSKARELLLLEYRGAPMTTTTTTWGRTTWVYYLGNDDDEIIRGNGFSLLLLLLLRHHPVYRSLTIAFSSVRRVLVRLWRV